MGWGGGGNGRLFVGITNNDASLSGSCSVTEESERRRRRDEKQRQRRWWGRGEEEQTEAKLEERRAERMR